MQTIGDKLAKMILERERLRADLKTLRNDMQDATVARFFDESAALREQVAELERRIVETARNAGQAEMPLDGDGEEAT